MGWRGVATSRPLVTAGVSVPGASGGKGEAGPGCWRPKNKAGCPRTWPPPIGASRPLISFYGC